jgi:hypothetical protein
MPFQGVITAVEQPVSKRMILSLLILAVAPAVAAAQFTTFIAPPNPVKDSIKAVVAAEQKAASDSVTRAQITNMKTWVDSAAGVVAPPVDTSMVQAVVSSPPPATGGMIAPATASPVPFLLTTGLAGMLLGLFMVLRPRPRPRRIDEE